MAPLARSLAGTSLLAYSAGRAASTYATWPASTVFSDTSASFSATSSVIGTRWCIMQPGVGGVGHLSGVRREYGQRDRGPAHEQEATDALEQDDRAAISPCSYRRAERDA